MVCEPLLVPFFSDQAEALAALLLDQKRKPSAEVQKPPVQVGTTNNSAFNADQGITMSECCTWHAVCYTPVVQLLPSINKSFSGGCHTRLHSTFQLKCWMFSCRIIQSSQKLCASRQLQQSVRVSKTACCTTSLQLHRLVPLWFHSMRTSYFVHSKWRVLR